jgi:hypothetical protein
MIMNTIIYDTTFEFDLTGKVSFGDLSTELIHKLFTDGRVASKFLEHHLPIWFPELEFRDAQGYDHVRIADGRRFDLKGFTPRGACYAPSEMLGKGRRIIESKVHAHAREIDYIFSDITEFPRVRIVFKRGTDMVEQFPNTKIKYNQREQLFGRPSQIRTADTLIKSQVL